MPQSAQRADIPAIDFVGVRHGGDGPLDAGLAQEMQHGIGGTVRAVFDVVRLGSRELIPRMKARDLQLAFQTQLDQRRVADLEEVVVFDEVGQNPGMNQQRCFAAIRIRLIEGRQFLPQILQQRGGGALFADPESDTAAKIDALRERAQVETDDGYFQPAASRRGDFFGIDG